MKVVLSCFVFLNGSFKVVVHIVVKLNKCIEEKIYEYVTDFFLSVFFF